MEINTLLQTLSTPLPVHEYEALQKRLEVQLRYLIENDFERLVQLLYTHDVDEHKLKSLLQQQPGKEAAAILADLMIERARQKWHARQQFTAPSPMDDEEKW